MALPNLKQESSSVRVLCSTIDQNKEKEKKYTDTKDVIAVFLNKPKSRLNCTNIFKLLLTVCAIFFVLVSKRESICGNFEQEQKTLRNDVYSDRKERFGLLKVNKKEKGRKIEHISESVNKESTNGICKVLDSMNERLTSFVPSSVQNSGKTEVTSGTTMTESEQCDAIEKKSLLHRIGNFFRRKQKNKKHFGTKKKNAIRNSHRYTDVQIAYAQELATSIREKSKKSHSAFDTQMQAIAWGGPGSAGRPWWTGSRKGGKGEDGDGVKLMLSYLKIMKFPEDNITNFPFELCQKGCSTDFALLHTLEWREKFKPWLITPAAIKENEAGFVYVHGHSPDVGGKPGPSIIFFRPGLHTVDNEEGYLRALVNALEFAVADSLRRSENRSDKYNVLIDNTNFKIANMGGVRQVKRAFRMLKDHFPDKLNHLFLTNLGRPAQLFLKLLSQFIDKDVRDKMHIVPNDPKVRVKMLRPFFDEDFIPTWLGGKDTYEFDAQTHYYSRAKSLITTDEDGIRYLKSMPYHGP